jgi:hypothetical protein
MAGTDRGAGHGLSRWFAFAQNVASAFAVFNVPFRVEQKTMIGLPEEYFLTTPGSLHRPVSAF